jgi:hypothetical protein
VPKKLYDFDLVKASKDKFDFRMPEIGDKVEIPSISIKGIIQYINQKDLFKAHMYPIQVLLKEPLDGQMMQRTNLKDIKYLEE